MITTLHVCADPEAASAEIVYPASHTLQSTSASISQSVPSLPSYTVAVPLGQVQILTVQIKVLN